MATFEHRVCPATGLRIHKSAENLIKANAVTAIVFLAVGGLFGLLVGLTRLRVKGHQQRTGNAEICRRCLLTAI